MNTASTDTPLSRRKPVDLGDLNYNNQLRASIDATVNRLMGETPEDLRSTIDWFGFAELLCDAFQFCHKTMSWSDYVDEGSPWIEFSMDLDGTEFFFEGFLERNYGSAQRFEHYFAFNGHFVRNAHRYDLGTLSRDQFVALFG